MAFDQPTRNRLARFVGEARRLIADEFTQQFQSLYGIGVDGTLTPPEQLGHLDETQRVLAARLRERVDYLIRTHPDEPKPAAAAVERLAREQAFTVLNRLAAVRMAEKRDIIVESVGRGYQARGFQVFSQVSGSGLGEIYSRYRRYLFCLFDELAVDLGVLFDRRSPAGMLFPREAALLQLLELLNAPDLESLWAEDETIGWIYQYYNDTAERKKMREQSAAPRNSRELAVRNQFFTPRYVVEFLTDNTLGRLWYEMTRGQTRLKEQCRYLVRRPPEIFLRSADEFHFEGCRAWVGEVCRGNFAAAREDATWDEMASVALMIDGWAVAEQLGLGDVHHYSRARWDRLEKDGSIDDASLLDQWLMLFSVQRGILREGAQERFPEYQKLVRAVWSAWMRAARGEVAPDAATPSPSQEELLRQPVLIPVRPLKDPREIRLLDPACGSMHFGLYAFDLFETIYAEAWDRGLISPAAYGGDKPLFPHASVRLDRHQESVHSNDLHQLVRAATARVVMLKESDMGDGMMHVGPFITDDKRTFRPGTHWDVPLADFDYAASLAAEHFTQDQGERLVRETPGAWEHDRFDPSPKEEVWAAFRRDVPRLILEHNLHGIDIDPRAVQIAGLSLWLRAQRAWLQMGLRPAERPQVRRANVVCAEPMPGEQGLLREFTSRLRPAALGGFVERVVDRMRLAGEAGALLKIEEEITAAVSEAKARWQSGPTEKQDEMFAVNAPPQVVQSELPIDVSGISDGRFFEQAEAQIYEALRAYAEETEDSGLRGFQRRLFAEDAARGFAFIDVCRKRYDVVVMNPPFGLMGTQTYHYAFSQFPDSYSDFGIAFMDRGLGFGEKRVLVGAITSRSYFSVKDAEGFRSNIAIPKLQLVIDLGLDVMDGAWVDSAAQIFSGSAVEPTIQFIKSRGDVLTPEIISDRSRCISRLRDAFRSVPKSRLSYELDGGLENLLSSDADGLEESNICLSRTGGKTFDDERFRRVWWEVRSEQLGKDRTWCFVAQSSEFNLFYYSHFNVVKWNADGIELGERNRQVNGETAQARQGESFFFKPGISFSRRGEPSIAFRTHPASCMFSSNGPVVLPIDPHDAFYLLGLLNSSWIRAAIHTQAHKFSYTVGHVKAVTWIAPERATHELVAESAKRIITIKRLRFRMDERDNLFVAPFVVDGSRLEDLYKIFVADCGRTHIDLVNRLDRIDVAVANTYSLSTKGIDLSRYNISVRDVADPSDIPFSSVTDFVESISGYLLGSAFGRWNICYAMAGELAPELPDPFASLPVCPLGMLQDADTGLPAREAPPGYPLRISWPGILVDDPGHPEDIEGRVREVLEILWPDRADAIEQEAVGLLGVKSLRDYFRRPAGFFADHLKRYSKSRRQAPIYWPLSTASGSYTLWIYHQRITNQTLHTAIADFLDPKLKALERDITARREFATSPAPSNAAVTRLGELIDFRDEIVTLRVELERVIALPWQPNLNDGVLITASPLWRLFRLGKWQKDLKASWESLSAGEYDWAHLAYSIWPDRVREKCQTDRSLAIAHNLEDLCTIEPPKPKTKRQRKETVE